MGSGRMTPGKSTENALHWRRPGARPETMPVVQHGRSTALIDRVSGFGDSRVQGVMQQLKLQEEERKRRMIVAAGTAPAESLAGRVGTLRPAAPAEPLLAVAGVSKSFGGTQALDNVSMALG